MRKQIKDKLSKITRMAGVHGNPDEAARKINKTIFFRVPEKIKLPFQDIDHYRASYSRSMRYYCATLPWVLT